MSAGLARAQLLGIYWRMTGDPPDDGSSRADEIAAEMAEVVAAPTAEAGGEIVAWWTNDWERSGRRWTTPTKWAAEYRRRAANVIRRRDARTASEGEGAGG